MNTANWITLIVTLVGLASTWGGLLARLKMVEARTGTLERGREKQGERIGVVEERTAALEGAAGVAAPRRRTRGVPVLSEDSGNHGESE